MLKFPMYYRTILLLGVLFLIQTAQAQTSRGLKMIEQGEYAGAEPIFRSALGDPQDRVIGYYGLAYIYSEPEFSGYRLDSAYAYIEASKAAYQDLDYKDRGKVTKDLSNSLIGRRRTQILKAALSEAEAAGTITAYQHFLDNFPESGSRYEGKALQERNRLAFEGAASEDSESAYARLLEQYGEDLKAKNRNLYDAAQKAQFERHIARNGWSAYEDFAAQHPDNIYVRDSLYEEFQALWYGPVTGYRDFITNYPEAPITRYAVDSLGMRLAQRADTVLSRQFIGQYPDHPTRDLVYGTWYASLKDRFRNITDLERFQAANPDFPYPERLQEDRNLFLDRSYEKLEVGKALGAFRAFIDKNPEYSKIDSVWMRYYLTFKQERPGVENLDRFLKVHPEFPFPDVVEKDRVAIKANAMQEEWETLQGGEGTGELFRYLKAKPNSPFRDSAINLLAERLLTEGQYQSIEGFLGEYPEHDYRPMLLNKLWEVFPEKDNAQALNGFILKYPDFPKPELLEQAVAEVPLSEEEVRQYDERKRDGFINYINRYAPEPKAFDALWRMLEVSFNEKDWDAAYQTMLLFKEAFGDANAEYTQWLRAFHPDARVVPVDISPNINTEREEYSAVITADDQTIYFCRNNGTDKINEDVYVSTRDAAGNWQVATPIEALVTRENEAPEAISADGNRMLIFFEGRIGTSDKTREGWSKPKPLNKNINRSTWQADARMTADGQAIIFTSEKGVLRGNKDIYISRLQEDGTWGPAQSLGDTINTQKDDRSPFLHPDMETLYFSSAGHRGLGGLDIFMSKRLDSTWTNWSEPVNLGPGFNTPGNDWSFKVTTDGKQGYFNILSRPAGGDIYIVPLPETYQPKPVATVSGLLTSIDGAPIDAQIIWVNLETGKSIQYTTSDPEDGTFFATLPSLGRYGYTIKKEGYFPISGNLDFSEKLYHHRLEKAMTILTVEEMKAKDLAVPLNNLFFETAKFDIKPESFPELNGLAEWVLDNKLAIEVSGHTDTVGEAAANLTLSRDRAQAVREYLIGRGLDAARIQAQGYGETKPVASNLTPEGRAQNRRVEIRIIDDGR